MGWKGSYDPIWPQGRDPTGRRRDRGPRLDGGLAQESADDGNDYQVREMIRREKSAEVGDSLAVGDRTLL